MITTRIDHITHLTPDRMHERPSAPTSVKIELTGRCNYRCGFCALTIREEQPKHDLDWDLFCRMTMEMRRAGVEEVGVFFIGESFMNPDLLLRAIRYLKNEVEMPYVFLTSNASIATPPRVEACMAAGLDSLKWSANAMDDEQFESVMGVKAKMAGKAREHIKAAWEIRNRGHYGTKLYASSIRYNGVQDAKMQAKLAEDILPYVDQHYWLPLYSFGSLATPREEDLGFTPGIGNTGVQTTP